MNLNFLFFLFGFFNGIFLPIFIDMFCRNDFSLKNAIQNYKLNFFTKNIAFKIIFCIFYGIIHYYIYYFKIDLINSFIICILLNFLIIISFVDLKIMIIPDTINFLIFIISIIYIIFNKLNIIYHIAGFFLISTPFLILSIFKGGVGGGDIKLFAVCGLFLGCLHIFLAMFISFLLASIFGIFLKLLNKTKLENNKHAIPLAPYIAFGVMISIIFGDNILNWYFLKIFT